jgi:hypothetical protein
VRQQPCLPTATPDCPLTVPRREISPSYVAPFVALCLLALGILPLSLRAFATLHLAIIKGSGSSRGR